MPGKVAPDYRMTISLNVVTHLGLNLYSNVPAVMAEAIANAWDADATEVDVNVLEKGKQIEISDNGDGMDLADVNERFLFVGYERRIDRPTVTPRNRHVIGRKGIGKLSLFSIARHIDVYTTKNGEKHGFRLSIDEIRAQSGAPNRSFEYRPKALPGWPTGLDRGTRLILTKLKKPLRRVKALRARVARRFTIIGPEHDFSVSINGKPITVEDLDFYKQIQFVWTYGSRGTGFGDLCTNKVDSFPRGANVRVNGKPMEINGWIGSVFNSKTLKGKDEKDSLNKIPVLAHGKVVDEDILEKFAEGGVYERYLIGALEVNNLDDDKLADITTSARQRVIEDDPRYAALVAFARGELSEIQNKWKDLRNKQGVVEALLNPAIKDWFDDLKGDVKKSAERLFGKINELPIDDPSAKTLLLQQSVLAFETFRYQQKLGQLDQISPEQLPELARLFVQLDDIEAALYFRIVVERLRVIEKLQAAVIGGVKEKAIQKHLYDHLWLLNQAWDRGTETPVMEETVGKAFKDVTKHLTAAQRRYRFDIRYKQAPSSHVIIELKRATARITTTDIMEQLGRYDAALRAVLKQTEPNPHIDLICVVGRQPTDWTDDAATERWQKALEGRGIRVVFYRKMIDDAQRAYARYIEKKKDVGRIQELVQRIENPLGETLKAA